MTDDKYYMQLAIDEARKAYALDEVPVGAVIVSDGVVISSAHNLTEARQDPTAHAELLSIKAASEKINSRRLLDTTLFVTKEPCPMCAGAILNSRIPRVVFGCRDNKGGAVSLFRLLTDDRMNHSVELVSGVMATESADLLKSFFEKKRL